MFWFQYCDKNNVISRIALLPFSSALFSCSMHPDLYFGKKIIKNGQKVRKLQIFIVFGWSNQKSSSSCSVISAWLTCLIPCLLSIIAQNNFDTSLIINAAGDTTSNEV